MVTLISIYGIFVVFSAIGLRAKRNSKTINKYLVAIAFMVLAIFGAIRLNDLCDYQTYFGIWRDVTWEAVFGKDISSYEVYSSEPLYRIFNYISKLIYNDFHFFLFLEIVVVNFLLIGFSNSIARGLRKKTDTAKSLAFTSSIAILCITMFFGMGCYNMLIVRQTIAVAICLYSIKYIKRKNLLKFLICCLCACLIHRASIVWIPAYIIFHFNTTQKNKRRFFCWGITVMGVISIVGLKLIAPFIPGILGAKVRTYISIGNDGFGQNFNILSIIVKTLLNVGVLLVVGLYAFSRYRKNRVYAGYFNLFFIGAAINVLSLFVSNQFARLATPYMMVQLAIIVYFLASIRNVKTRRAFAALVMLYYFVRLFVYVRALGIDGYETIWGLLL